MAKTAAQLLVECLEAEGVERVFGIPGEETLDLNAALAESSIEFVPVRHEQGGAYIADVYGRLTGRAGVCLGTLGPGATNLVTAVADAYLDRAPLVALTGQAGLERQHKESHQHIDIVEMMGPITKWNRASRDPGDDPRGRAQGVQGRGVEKPGSAHIELPEDVMAAEVLVTHQAPLLRPARRRSSRAGRRSRPRRLIREAERRLPRRQRRGRARRLGGAARVRARDRHPGRRDVHGQGPDRGRLRARPRRRRAAGRRLRASRVSTTPTW